jgi:N-acetylmuramoyl-L-alanine amidase
MKMFLLLQVLLGGQAVGSPEVNLPLANVQVVIDPGHGGTNPGLVYHYRNGKENRLFIEKVYTCDVSARLVKILENLGAHVVSTIQGSCLGKPQSNPTSTSSRIRNTDELFATTGKGVHGDSLGLKERVKLAEEVARLHPDERTVYVSIHFDSGYSRKLHGAYIIVPPSKASDPLAVSLAGEFSSAGLTGQGFCRKPTIIVAIGTCGIKNILILKSPPVDNMVLLELGNIGNNSDRAKVLDPTSRQKYADLIADGIVRFSKE